ncbi:MAG: PilZ domain-containing protein [Pseudomonadota bacterium]|nr:PilZ domain-containing protein [Pseudomonadota bacterium]
MSARSGGETDVRRSERIAVDETTRLRPNSWSSLEVRIVDLSEDGFRAECEAMVMVGGPVWVDLPGIGEVEAQVSWRRGGEIGARFVLPLDLASCTLEPLATEAVLARLLVQRADARSTGRYRQEQRLREQILSALPMRKIEG